MLIPDGAVAQSLGLSAAPGPFRMVNAEGTVEVHTRLPDDLVQIEVDYGDGTGVRELRKFGVYPVEQVDLKDGLPVSGTVGVFSYSDVHPAPPRAHEVAAVEMRSVTRFETGEVRETRWQRRYGFGPLQEVDIGGVPYRVEEVQLEQRAPSPPLIFETYWRFVDLGIAHLQASGMGTARFETPLVSLA